MPRSSLEPPISLTLFFVSAVWARTVGSAVHSPPTSPSEGSLKGLQPALTPRADSTFRQIYIQRDFKNVSHNYIQPVARGLRPGATLKRRAVLSVPPAVMIFQRAADLCASPRFFSPRYAFCPPPALISAFPEVLSREWAQSCCEGGLRITPIRSGNGHIFVLATVFLCEIFCRKSFRFVSRARRLGKF